MFKKKKWPVSNGYNKRGLTLHETVHLTYTIPRLGDSKAQGLQPFGKYGQV
jgi:hypothetical protein